MVDLDGQPPAGCSATGFVFQEATAEALWDTIERVLATWSNSDIWEQLMRNGMAADWSWSHSAGAYVRLYEEIRRRVQPSPVQSVVELTAPAQ